MSNLLQRLDHERACRLKGGIYHHIQVKLTYNSNHIEGSKLTSEQTRMIYETRTLLPQGDSVNVDDVIETTNHFRCIDYIISHADEPLSIPMIKQLHLLLKQGTSGNFAIGDFKKLPNEVGGMETTPVDQVESTLTRLITCYNSLETPTLDDIIDFHYRFESIHPFQDGNGRVGRLIMFKECLKNNIVPFIITDELKGFYYRGLQNWPQIKGYLRDTCLTAQDDFKLKMRYFKIDE